MGAGQKNDIKTAHSAVKYCINTQNEYELPKIECFLKVLFWLYAGSFLELDQVKWVHISRLL